jgi:hypothetical protein
MDRRMLELDYAGEAHRVDNPRLAWTTGDNNNIAQQHNAAALQMLPLRTFRDNAVVIHRRASCTITEAVDVVCTTT